METVVCGEGPLRLCLQDAVLEPLSFFVTILLVRMRFKDLKGRSLKSFEVAGESVLQLGQWLIVTLLLFQSIAALALSFIEAQDFLLQHKIRWGVHTFNWLLTLYAMHRENRAEVDRGWQLLLSWMIQMLLVSAHVYLDLLGIDPDLPGSLSEIGLALVLLLCLLGLFNSPSKVKAVALYSELKDGVELTPIGGSSEKKVTGELTASWASKLAFSWLSPLLRKGKITPLNASDLFDLDEEDDAGAIGKMVLESWLAEKRAKGEKATAFQALWKCFGNYFIVTGLFKLSNDIFIFIPPIMLRQLVNFIEYGPTEGQSTSTGFLLAVSLFLAATIQSLSIAQYFHRGYRNGSRIRSAIQYLVYQHSLKMSPNARQKTSVGNAVNLMSSDSNRLSEMMPYLHSVWSSPLQIVIATYLLYQVMGFSAILGILSMIVMMPLNTKVSQKQMQLSRQIQTSNDKRGKVINEILQGIRIIKYFAWEDSFKRKIEVVRKDQMDLMWKNAHWGVISTFLWACSPLVVALVTFDTFVLSGNTLSAGTAFSALALFNVMRFPLNSLPMIINFLLEGKVSIDRVTTYLQSEEIDPNFFAKEDATSDKTAVSVKDCTFWWQRIKPVTAPPAPKLTILQRLGLSKKPDPPKPVVEEASVPFFLRDVSFEVSPGQLVGIAGPTGCGKSTLVAALIGQLNKDKGSISLSGRIAMAPQQPWVQNATVRENITFGMPFDEEKYKRVLFACALEPDLDILSDRDNTEIGENGINLSGGQKARVSLARACYADADIVILDDPLSAVDVHVGHHLFEHCIKGLLKDKTRILISHHTQYFIEADLVIVMQKDDAKHQGSIEIIGTYPEVREALKHSDEIESAPSDEKPITTVSTPKSATEAAKPRPGPATAKPTGAGTLVQKESKEEGVVRASVWKGYVMAMGPLSALMILGGFFLSSGAEVGSRVWLSIWSVDTEGSPYMYLGIYSAISVGVSLATLLRSYLTSYGTLTAAKNLHNTMVARVLRAPTKFFDTTPTGRILNRFVGDQKTIDDLRQNLGMLLMSIFSTAATTVLIISINPIIAVVLVPLGALYYFTQNFFRASSRELKRLDAITKSPIFAHFTETLNGVSTIIALGAGDRFLATNTRLVSANTSAYMINNASNRWLGIRLEFLGNLVVLCVALLSVIQNTGRRSAAGFVGLSLTSALDITNILNWLIRMFTQTESNMVCAERLKEYSEIEVEAPAICPDNRPPSDWPQEGRIEFRDVSMRYRDGLPLALDGVSFSLRAGEKVGVVGRTGAGKSTLAVVLFRLVELQSGSILIDSYDIKKIGLKDLRSKIAIIPQDPILFVGSVRSNLDPFNEFNDEELWTALEKIHLASKFRESPSGLNSEVQENGGNFSVGQRQLLCMARAFLRQSKVLLMDEATASIDTQLDGIIQEMIQTQLRSMTVITIAHRLSTVLSCDKILVMGSGNVLEFGTPTELSSDPSTNFYAMTHSDSAAKEMLS